MSLVSYKEIFNKNWNNIIIGISGGLAVYFGTRINSKLISAIYIFLFALLITLIYSFFNWRDKDNQCIKKDSKDIKQKKLNNKTELKGIKNNSVSFIIGILGLIIAIGGIYLAYYQIEYPKLFVNQTIIDNGDGTGRLQVYIENQALLKPTGTINFFRLNINPSIPHMQVDSLDPGENITFDTDIKISNKNYPFKEDKAPPGALSRYGIPIDKLYFIMEEISISYKITCDNCQSQGILRRIPELGKIETGIILNQITGEQYGSLKIYSWTTYSEEDLGIKNNTEIK